MATSPLWLLHVLQLMGPYQHVRSLPGLLHLHSAHLLEHLCDILARLRRGFSSLLHYHLCRPTVRPWSCSITGLPRNIPSGLRLDDDIALYIVLATYAGSRALYRHRPRAPVHHKYRDYTDVLLHEEKFRIGAGCERLQSGRRCVYHTLSQTYGYASYIFWLDD